MQAHTTKVLAHSLCFRGESRSIINIEKDFKVNFIYYVHIAEIDKFQSVKLLSQRRTMAMNRIIVHCKCITIIACGVVLAYLWLCDRIENRFGEWLRERPRQRQIWVMTFAMLLFATGIAALSWISIGMEYYLIRALFRALSHHSYNVFSFAHAAGLDLSFFGRVGAQLADCVSLMNIIYHLLTALKHMAIAAMHMSIAAAIVAKFIVQHPLVSLLLSCSYFRIFILMKRAETVEEHADIWD